MNVIEKVIQCGQCVVELSSGKFARQADGAVFIRSGDTCMLATVVVGDEPPTAINFLPLSVNYQEKFYAVGRMPGGFIKREGRPSIHETLVSRLVDRSLRPLFPDGFCRQVQIIVTLLSLDPTRSSDVPMLALIGASAATAIAKLPLSGLIAGVRIGYINGEYLINPSTKEMDISDLDLVVAGTADSILMVESMTRELSKEVILKSVAIAQGNLRSIVFAIAEFVHMGDSGDSSGGSGTCGCDVSTCTSTSSSSCCYCSSPEIAEYITKAKNTAKALLDAAYNSGEKNRQHAMENARNAAHEKILKMIHAEKATMPHTTSGIADITDEILSKKIKEMLRDTEEKVVRENILKTGIRVDGRTTTEIRPITVELNILPRTHGSACFTRGNTQALVATTLSTDADAQRVDTPGSTEDERFILHYNFLPFCTGEIGQVGSPKRREIGHGNLARKALALMMPAKNDFPYVVRIVSEILESNGSSSMATVCGSSLSMMVAGVPIKGPVAGIAMGLIKEGDKFAILSDILGYEDHIGDMDFKVTGTEKGITALQMDIKIGGVTEDIMHAALTQAEEGLKHILGIMNKAISTPKDDISIHAPKITTIKISTDKIRDVIGKGGATIRSITERTGAEINIEDTGIITISAVDSASSNSAVDIIKALTESPEVGKIYSGKVVKIAEFGAFVNILPNIDGLVHISQISHDRVKRVEDVLREGQMVNVKIIDIDRTGRLKLSIKEVE